MIPRIVHRPWLGPHEPPAEHDYTAQWAATNPGWELRTWTDQNVHELFPLVCQAEYDAAPTYVHRADLILPEAVLALGGVAVGYDMEPLRPLEPLIGEHDCWCTPDADGFAGGAFFGAVPGHRAIRHVLDTIHTRIARQGWAEGWHQPHVDTGPWAWGEAFGRFGEQCPDYGMSLLGDYRTAYPIRYWEKGKLTAGETRRRMADAVVAHKFAGSWLHTDVTVRRSACSPSTS